MMLKVTLNFSYYWVIILFSGCAAGGNEGSLLEIQRLKDSVSEARIDSAYLAIKSNCETLMIYQVPKMVDSLLKDSTLLQHFFDTGKIFSDADNKVEKVVRQLQADCDSNLLKETCRKVLLRLQSKLPQRKKQKV
jgi:hypothetical protein